MRPDLIRLSPDGSDIENASIENASPTAKVNQLSARITDVELTGYVTRVSLFVESTGQSLLHKLRTTDWMSSPLPVGERIRVQWSAYDSVFLPY